MASLITPQFEQDIAQATANGSKIVIDGFIFAFIEGLNDNNLRDHLTIPQETQIKHRQDVSQAGVINRNAVVYSVTMGTEIGDFDFNFIGLINKQQNKLIAAIYTDTIKKIKNKKDIQGNSLTRSILLEFKGAEKLTQIQINANTWQIDFTARLHGLDEKNRLTNLEIYGNAAFFADGFKLSRKEQQNRTFLAAQGVAYIGGLRAELAEPLEVIGQQGHIAVLDVHEQLTVTGSYQTQAQVNVIEQAEFKSHYQDDHGITHYCAKIALFRIERDFDRRKLFATDLRTAGKLNPLDLTADTTSQATENGHAHRLPQGDHNTKGIVQTTDDLNSESEQLALSAKGAKKLKQLIDEKRIETSEAVNSDSTTTVANSKAVKKAYDKAESAHNEAAKKLPLTGGTLTGKLIINHREDEKLTAKLTNGEKLTLNVKNQDHENALSFHRTSSRGNKAINFPMSVEDENVAYQEWTNQQINKKGVPLGSIVAFPTQVRSPQGFLLCDGSTFEQDTYPDLYRTLGNSNKLPDLTKRDVGMLAYFPFDQIPEGWLPCNGDGITKADHPELFDRLKEKYGTYQSGNTEYARLPNPEDRFIRNAANGLTVGQKQAGTLTGFDSIGGNHTAFGAYIKEIKGTLKDTADQVGGDLVKNTEDYNAGIAWADWGGEEQDLRKCNKIPDNRSHFLGVMRPHSIAFKLCIKVKSNFDQIRFFIKAYGAVTNIGNLNAGNLASEIHEMRHSYVSNARLKKVKKKILRISKGIQGETIWRGKTSDPVVCKTKNQGGVIYVLFNIKSKETRTKGYGIHEDRWLSFPLLYANGTVIGDTDTGGDAGDYNYNTVMGIRTKNVVTEYGVRTGETEITITPLIDKDIGSWKDSWRDRTAVIKEVIALGGEEFNQE
ncbi:phage tail protein, partial [Seminibacterium arietis]